MIPSFAEFCNRIATACEIDEGVPPVNEQLARALYDSMRPGSVESATISSGNYVLSDGSGKVVAELGPFGVRDEMLDFRPSDVYVLDTYVKEGKRYLFRLVEVEG